MYLREAVRRFVRSYSSRVRSIPALNKTRKAELRKPPRRKLTQDIQMNDKQFSFSLMIVVKGEIDEGNKLASPFARSFLPVHEHHWRSTPNASSLSRRNMAP